MNNPSFPQIIKVYHPEWPIKKIKTAVLNDAKAVRSLFSDEDTEAFHFHVK